MEVKNQVACFGELLLRFSPRMQGVFIKEQVSPVFIGGAELNVATALAHWNVSSKYITSLPDNYLSHEIIQSISSKGIDTNSIKINGERIGIYYLPEGADLKNNAVIYDRKYSSFSELSPGDINWDAALENVSWLHISAISPALNNITAALCLEAVQQAAAKKITVSIDLNYRSRLWQYGKSPIKVMPAIVKFCDVIMGNIWSAESLLDISPDKSLNNSDSKETFILQAEITSKKIQDQFPVCKVVANTFRFEEGNGTRYYASLYKDGSSFYSNTYRSELIAGKVGSGDCFMAGLIYGLYNKHSNAAVVEFAAAAAFGKLHEKADATENTIQDIKNIIANG